MAHAGKDRVSSSYEVQSEIGRGLALWIDGRSLITRMPRAAKISLLVLFFLFVILASHLCALRIDCSRLFGCAVSDLAKRADLRNLIDWFSTIDCPHITQDRSKITKA